MPRLSHTINLPITGRSALAAVGHNLSGDPDGVALMLAKMADPTSEAEADVSLERAEEIIAADPALLYLSAEIEIWAAEAPRWRMWVRCGVCQIKVQDDNPAGAFELLPIEKWQVEIAAAPPEDAEQLRPSQLGADLRGLAKNVAEVLATHFRRVLDEAGLP